jgi:hypothetical protein
MPLFKGALALIRANLEELQKGNRVRLVAVGTLTDSQLEAINREREARGYPAMAAEVVFIGRHVYESRVVRDGYTIDDVIDQIASAMEGAAVVLQTPTMTAMENPAPPGRTITETPCATGLFLSVQPDTRSRRYFQWFRRATIESRNGRPRSERPFLRSSGSTG